MLNPLIVVQQMTDTKKLEATHKQMDDGTRNATPVTTGTRWTEKYNKEYTFGETRQEHEIIIGVYQWDYVLIMGHKSPGERARDETRSCVKKDGNQRGGGGITITDEILPPVKNNEL